MTDEQRGLLDRIATLQRDDLEAIRAAVAEVDRLRAGEEKTRRLHDEIDNLKERLDGVEASHEDEEVAHMDTLRLLGLRDAEVARLKTLVEAWRPFVSMHHLGRDFDGVADMCPLAIAALALEAQESTEKGVYGELAERIGADRSAAFAEAARLAEERGESLRVNAPAQALCYFQLASKFRQLAKGVSS